MDDDVNDVHNWKDFYIEIIQQLADIDINLIINYAEFNSNNRDINYTIFVKPNADMINSYNDNKNYFEISLGIFANVSISNWAKFQSLKNLFDIYQIPYSNLEIYLQESKN